MTFRKKLILAAGTFCVAALASPAMADRFAFGFSYGHGPRYYRSYCAPVRAYTYYDAPVVAYDPGPEVVVYDPPAPVVVRSYYAPTYRSYYYPTYRYVRPAPVYYRSYYPAYRSYGHHTNIRVHGSWRH